MGSKSRSKSKSKRGRRRPPLLEDESTNAVLQGTVNEDDDSSVSTEESVNSLETMMKNSPILREAIRRAAAPTSSLPTLEERSVDQSDGLEAGGGGGKTLKAKIFDQRRRATAAIALVGIALVVIISAALFGSGGGFDEPPLSFSTFSATSSNHPTADGLPHLHKYAYVFVAYDKSGYAVAEQLYDQLEESMEDDKDHDNHPAHGHLAENFVDSRGAFDHVTKCTEINLEPSTVTILEAPEFHCNPQKIRSLFMDHADLHHEKWGVKLIHLVRNPFSMAVANYRYLKSHHPPEEVRFKNPCASLTSDSIGPSWENLTAANLNLPILSENGIMTREDFDSALGLCAELFQTRPGLETASYHHHLEHLPPGDGVRLALADRLNFVALMASDLISFRRMHELVEEEALNPKRKRLRHFDMMTLPLDEVSTYPGNSMVGFLDFVFGSYLPAGAKRKAAAEYERNKFVDDSVEMDAGETDELIGLLRNDPVFGGPLARVEALLETVLSGEGGEEQVEA